MAKESSLRLIISVMLLSVFAATGLGAEPLVWPQFRGPGASGIAEGQTPPIEFGPAQNVKWKVSIPGGISSPIIVGNLLVLTAFENNKLLTIAYTRTDGKEAWRAEAPAKKIEPFHQVEGNPAASTPATDGTRIVSYFGSCGLLCYDLSGKELWRYALPTAASAFDFGSGVSPILTDGLVVLLRDERTGSKIIAVDSTTGKLKWEKARLSNSSFCTPTVCDTPAGKQVVAGGNNRLIGYDLKTGDEKWFVAGMPVATCTTPVVVGDTLFFAAWATGDDMKLPDFDALVKLTGDEKRGHLTKEGMDKTLMKGLFDNFDPDHDGKITRAEWESNLKLVHASKNSAFALRLGGSGDVSKSHVIWRQTKGLPYVPSGIVYQGQFVMVKDGGLVTAYDAKSGKAAYVQERAVAAGRYYASPVAANGHIYFTALEDGSITVLKAGATEPTVVANNPKLNERVAATPAIADNTLYVRTAGHLYAFAEKR
jgi:outer membrane protein assembly factor BamB